VTVRRLGVDHDHNAYTVAKAAGNPQMPSAATWTQMEQGIASADQAAKPCRRPREH
jgi:hypothetical protein